MIAARRQDHLADESGRGSVGRPGEVVAQRDGHIQRLDALDPRVDEAARLGDHGGPVFQQGVEAQGRLETAVHFGPLVPDPDFFRIEGIVGHHDAFDARAVEHARDVIRQAHAAEEVAGFAQIGSRGVESERREDRDHPARGLGQGRVADEERLPDQVRLGRPRQLLELLRPHVRRSHQFGDQVVVGEQLVDAPVRQLAERGRKEVRVHVEDRRLVDDLRRLLANGLQVDRVSHGRKAPDHRQDPPTDRWGRAAPIRGGPDPDRRDTGPAPDTVPHSARACPGRAARQVPGRRGRGWRHLRSAAFRPR